MINHAKEDALSEVIGFILIIAVITIIASLYMVYVVPAQGREAEIEHMNYVKDQFVDFKIRMDSLWLNNEPNVTVSQNIEMGTLGKKTEGNLVVIPILQPVGSDGTIEVDTESDPTIAITTKAYAVEDTFTPSADKSVEQEGIPRYTGSGIYPTNIVTINPGPIPTPRDHLTIPFPSWRITPVNLTQSGENPPWIVDLNVTNSTRFYPDYEQRLMDENDAYDIEMSLKKFDQGQPRDVFQNMTIFRDIENKDYTIDLYDPAYGLNQNYAFTSLVVNEFYGGTHVEPDNPIFTSIDTSLVTPWDIVGEYSELLYTTHSMGTFSYTGNNYYWIPQTYFYQMGGIFLKQNDGMTSKVVPLINLYVEPSTVPPKPGIRITDMHITEVDSQVSGTSPVQVLSLVEKTTKDRLYKVQVSPLPTEPPKPYILTNTPNNADYVTIKIVTEDADMQDLWFDTFNQIKYAATVSTDVTTSPFDPDWVQIDYDANHYPVMWVGSNDDINDVTLEYTAVNASIIIQPVGFSN